MSRPTGSFWADPEVGWVAAVADDWVEGARRVCDRLCCVSRELDAIFAAMATSFDERAFDALVRAHYGRLCDFVYRYVRSRATAEDIVQDVFVRVLRRGRFDVDDPLQYLYRAARNGAASHLRHQRVRERLRGEVATRNPQPRADADVQLHELEDAVAQAVESLPTRVREVFTMSREQGLSYAEIARALGISVKTVENHMGRALKLLRTRLAPFLSIGFAALSTSPIAERLFH